MSKAGGKKKTVQTKAKGAGGESAGKDVGAEIPKLDLDKQLLAKERRVTSVRRKGPGAKTKTPAEPSEVGPGEVFDGSRGVPDLAEEDRVIAEIVARDIRRLCGD